MAKATVYLLTAVTYEDHFDVIVAFKYKAGYKFHSDSLRVYYSTLPKFTSETPYVQPDLSNPFFVAANVKIIDGYYHVRVRVPGESDTQLDDNTKYYLRARFELFKTDGTHYKYYRAPKNPTAFYTREYADDQPLFMIEKYSNPYTEDGEQHYETDWVDFTRFITLPSYNVNYEDVEEDWEDADYVTHRIVPRSKITGSLELLFTDKYDYNNFIRLIRQNRVVNGAGYIRLRLQVNDNLDNFSEFTNYSEDQLRKKKALLRDGSFFLKMEDNPWTAPVYGHFDQYEPIRIEITEA